jgi:general secretion pathway protein E
MQIDGVIKCLAVTAMPFSPVRLAILLVWVYLCMHIVQRIQFSRLVPKNQKTIANIIALFLGPLFLLALTMVTYALTMLKTIGKTATEHGLKDKVQSAIASLRAPHFNIFKDETEIKLLNSSGTELKDIYTFSKGRRQDSHILDLTEQIIRNALEEGASDILVDPKQDSTYTIRFRIDGVLRDVQHIDTDTCKAVINSIKAVSNMDIAERRRPQDGSFIAKTTTAKTSLRVASAGAINGEKLSIRVLSQNAGQFSLTNVGLSEKQRTVIENAISKPAGMILMCGPTGSGKTTTLYAMLNKIDLFMRNVITVEDPIEYIIPNASQIEVNPKADITFAKTLRSILRQDPDVICVGEIRDEETASITLRASQTGHLVLATIHSESNASAMIRLLDLGVSALLLSSGLSLLVSQRLLRCLCSKCKVPAQLSQGQIRDFVKKNINYRNIGQPKGCEYCYGTGYRGRIAVFDLLAFDDNLKASIANNETLIMQLRKEGDVRGRSNLQKEGIKKVVSGVTSLDEMKRVIG